MGILYVAGIGPGNEDGMTVKVRRILDECPVIAGYKTYIRNMWIPGCGWRRNGAGWRLKKPVGTMQKYA